MKTRFDILFLALLISVLMVGFVSAYSHNSRLGYTSTIFLGQDVFIDYNCLTTYCKLSVFLPDGTEEILLYTREAGTYLYTPPVAGTYTIQMVDSGNWKIKLIVKELPNNPNNPDLEEQIADLTTRINILESELQESKSRISIVEGLIETLQAKFNNFVNGITGYLIYLPQGLRKNMLCNSLKAGDETSIDDLGLYCEIKQLKNKEKCVCKKI